MIPISFLGWTYLFIAGLLEEKLTNREFNSKDLLYGERVIKKGELISFPNPRPGRIYDVSIELPEFTCKCPFSGYPDFAVLKVTYQPGQKILELKAIKLYINSYREIKISHEEVVNQILDDLVTCCQPDWMKIEADFNPRGNVHTVITVTDGSKK